MVNRTKRLTLERALKILQLNYGTQIQKIEKNNNIYKTNIGKQFTREDILKLENEMYSNFGC